MSQSSPRSACCWRRATSTSPATSIQGPARGGQAKNADLDRPGRQGLHPLSRPEPEEPEPRQARGARGAEVSGRLRRASSANIVEGIGEIHQILPAARASSARSTTSPIKLDVAKAKELLAKAGLPERLHASPWTCAPVSRSPTSPRRSSDAGPGRHQARDHPGRRQADADQVSRPHPRHLYRPVGPGLSRSAHQCRDLRHQRGQWRRREVQDAGLAQCLGHPGDDQGRRRRRCWRSDAAKRAAMYRTCSGSTRRSRPSSSCSSRSKSRPSARTSTAGRSARASTPISSAPISKTEIDCPARTRRDARWLDNRRATAGAAGATRRRSSSAIVAARPLWPWSSPVDDLSSACCGHLLHRPRHPDRPGARGRRRPRAGQTSYERRARELGLDKPLSQQFCIYVGKVLTGDFGTLGADHQSGHDRHPPRLPGDARTGDARHADRLR